MPQGGGPGANDPFDPHDLDEVRMRIVMPVVTSLIRPGELERVTVEWSPPLTHDDSVPLGPAGTGRPRKGDEQLRVLVVARGSTWESSIWASDVNAPDDTMDRIAFRFADQLEDWVCECVAWGEQRIARYIIPARKPPS
jgi:hypothetical protein